MPEQVQFPEVQVPDPPTPVKDSEIEWLLLGSKASPKLQEPLTHLFSALLERHALLIIIGVALLRVLFLNQKLWSGNNSMRSWWKSSHNVLLNKLHQCYTLVFKDDGDFLQLKIKYAGASLQRSLFTKADFVLAQIRPINIQICWQLCWPAKLLIMFLTH